jgi:hypothetical protein
MLLALTLTRCQHRPGILVLALRILKMGNRYFFCSFA